MSIKKVQMTLCQQTVKNNFMKIAYIFDAIYPYEKGGVEKYIYLKAKRESAQGHEIHIYGLQYWEGNSIKQDGNIFTHGVIPAYNLYSKKGKRKIGKLFSYCGQLAKELLKTNYDRIECHAIPYLPIFICFAISLLKKNKLIIIWHEILGKYWFYFHPFLGGGGYLLEKLAWTLPVQHAAISPFVFQKLPARRRYLFESLVEWETLQKATPVNTRYDILYVGRFVEYKQMDLLIDALEVLRHKKNSPKTLLIGTGPLQNKIKTLARMKNLEHVEFLESVPNVYSYMKATKLLVLPSRREGLSFVTLEAQACGAKVITVDAPLNAAKILTPYVCQNNSMSLAQEIQRLL